MSTTVGGTKIHSLSVLQKPTADGVDGCVVHLYSRVLLAMRLPVSRKTSVARHDIGLVDDSDFRVLNFFAYSNAPDDPLAAQLAVRLLTVNGYRCPGIGEMSERAC